jgi:hypothetical protein
MDFSYEAPAAKAKAAFFCLLSGKKKKYKKIKSRCLLPFAFIGSGDLEKIIRAFFGKRLRV